MIQYGFIDIYGIAWDKSQVDQYNKIDEKVIRLESAEYDAEQTKIDRHRFYHMPLYRRMKDEC